jgi:hypothetical protein
MALTKQEVINKILSFNYSELKEWIRGRLHGRDEYFPLYLGHEPNFSEFLINSFHQIEDEKFRDNFIEILGKLTGELRKFSRDEVESSKSYIIELLKLCGNIRQFENKEHLMEIAVSGKFKGIKVDEETDLHADLLTTLASYKIVGTYQFWIDQLRDDTDRYYSNPAFYALIDNLNKLFEYIDIFIDKFKGDIELEWGVEALINDYGKKEIVKRFKAIDSRLSLEQKEAVNRAFVEIEENPVYKIDAAVDKEIQYKPVPSRLQYVSEPIPQYEITQTLVEKAAEIFKQMGFDVEMNYQMAGYSIDLFIKKKKTFGDKYECYICQCSEGSRKVSKDEVRHFLEVCEAVRNECKQQKNGCDSCDAIIVCEKGFTKSAVEIAAHQGIILKTLEELETGLR